MPTFPTQPYVFRVRVPITKARGLRYFLARRFLTGVLFDETPWRLFWRVFVVEAPAEMMAPLQQAVEHRGGGVFLDQQVPAAVRRSDATLAGQST